MPAFGARARLNPLLHLLLDDVVAVGDEAGLRIDAVVDVLEDRLLRAEELAVAAIELPEDARLADREHVLVRTVVHQHALEHFVEVERITGHVLVVPRQLAGVAVDPPRRCPG